IKNTSVFKNKVLNVSLQELNKYTELEVWYTEIKKGRSIVGFEIHWSTGKRESKATDKQVSLLRNIHDEINKNIFDYISVKDVDNLNEIRTNIMRIKEINQQVGEKLTSSKAKDLIWESKLLYKQLETILEQD